MSGNFIDNFNSITECAIQLNINKQGIKYVLQNRCKHCNNFFYSYELLSNKEIIEKINFIIKSQKIQNRRYKVTQ